MTAHIGDVRQNPSRLYRLCLSYLGAAIAFEILDQILFLRLLGVPYVAQSMLTLRLLVDTIFIMACLSCGLRVTLFRGAVVLMIFLMILWGTVLGFASQNDIIEIIKDIILFSFFVLKFVIFKAIVTSQEDLHLLHEKLKKYCLLTLYVAIFSYFTLIALRRVGFVFYEQGISNLEWYVAYALSANRTLGAFFGVLIAFLLGKRMVLAACLAIFLISSVIKLLRLNTRFLITLVIMLSVVILGKQFVTINQQTFAYAIRINFESIFHTVEYFSVDTILSILQLIDPGRYSESASAIFELKSIGVIFGGGFGFNYTDSYTREVVSNAHFSPIGLITKFGVGGMIVFYLLLIWGFLSAMYSKHPMVILCGYYLISVVFASVFAWKFFLSAPLLPLAFAVCWYSKAIRASMHSETRTVV